MQASPAFAAAALVLFCAGASAQNQTPGLWEHSVTIKSQNGEMEKAMADMQKQMASMPPEQRKQMEQMMASRGVGVGPKGSTSRVCVSKEEAARQIGPQMGEGDCTQQVVQRSAGTMKMKWECAGRNPSSGEGEVTFKSDKAYTGHAVVTSTVKGKPETMTIEQSGQWIAADCGAVKPRSPAKP
ncbi:MAG: DUF3617 domain-containing protein [Caldimonas sp.]